MGLSESRPSSPGYPSITTIEHDGKELTPSAFRARAIRDGLSTDQVELALLRAEQPQPGKYPGPGILVKVPAEGDLLCEAVSCSLLRSRFNVPAKAKSADGQRDIGYESLFSEEALEASDQPDLRNISLSQIMRQSIAAAGYFAEIFPAIPSFWFSLKPL